MINKHDAGLGKSILHQILEHTFQIGILPHLLFSGTREQPVQHFIKIQLQKLVCMCETTIQASNVKNFIPWTCKGTLEGSCLLHKFP